ncbi:hypothetical protein ACFL0H_08630 [Thermodesulfobacteriota bacterium]
MKMRIMLWFFTMFLSLFLIGSMSIAKEKGKGRPSGWDKEKKGWQSDVPPGQEKKLKAEKAKKKKERRENMSEEEREATMEKRKLETKKRWEDLSEEERKAIFEKYKTNKK